MLTWIHNNYKLIIRISYIIPILVAAGISIYHVIKFYEITNPMAWAIYLSVGVEIAALSALAGMAARMNKWIYVPFIIVTFIQILGNVFASYQYIDIDGEMFLAWVELFNPMFESFGWVEQGDLMAHKRILGIIAGIFIPIISLSFLHLLVSFNEEEANTAQPLNADKVNGPVNDTVKKVNAEVYKQPITTKSETKESIPTNVEVKQQPVAVKVENKPSVKTEQNQDIKNMEVNKTDNRGFSVNIPKKTDITNI